MFEHSCPKCGVMHRFFESQRGKMVSCELYPDFDYRLPERGFWDIHAVRGPVTQPPPVVELTEAPDSSGKPPSVFRRGWTMFMARLRSNWIKTIAEEIADLSLKWPVRIAFSAVAGLLLAVLAYLGLRYQ